MANIIIIQDIYGDAMLYNDNAYQKVGTTTTLPDALGSDVQFSSIGGTTYNNADSQGKTVYTAAERALALYEYGTRSSNIGVGDTAQLKYFQVSSSAPTVNDDSSEGFSSQCYWFHTTTGDLYVCSSSAVGAAVWTVRTTSTTASLLGGVLRIWGVQAAGSNYWINGVSQGAWAGSGEVTANVFNMVDGDYLQAARGGTTSTKVLKISFLPFAH